MSLHQWLGIGSIGVLITFIWFAFRQGMKVKPDHRVDHGPSVGGGDGSTDGHA